MNAPGFKTAFDPAHGRHVELTDNVLRVTAPNAGPFTFHGTNSYVLGRDTLAIIDPGPEDDSHYETLMRTVNGRPVSHIFITHTHADHSPLARRIAAETGAKTVAEGPHRAARALHEGEENPLDAAADRAFSPDITVSDGDRIEGDGWALETVLTPGHTANHAAFALAGTDTLFSGDHVMAWATSIVAPPDGAMAEYMASLDKLLERPESLYLPGHGGRVEKAREFVRALRAHRKMRESAILARIRAGDRSVRQIVERIYRDTDPRLHDAAALSVLAHLEDLVESGVVACDGPVSAETDFRPAG